MSASWGHREAWVNANCEWPFTQVKTTTHISALPHRVVHMPTPPGHSDILELQETVCSCQHQGSAGIWVVLAVFDCHCLVRPFKVPAGQFLSLGRGFRPACYILPAIITEKSIKNCLWSYRSCWSRGGVVRTQPCPSLYGFGREQVLLSPVWGLAFKSSVDQHSHVLLPWGQLEGKKETLV